MNQTYLPEAIRAFVGGKDYTLNSVGMSDSEVRIYDQYVLKIQPRTEETDNEPVITAWLSGRVPLPDIAAYCTVDETTYTLMTRAQGQMLCDAEYLAQPELLIRLAAQGLKKLWSIDVRDCPCRTSRLSERLKAAEYNVVHGLVDLSNVEPETFGANGFRDPQALLDWLKTHRPPEDLVLTHGDYCLPNILVKDRSISAFIDLGKMGPADRWQDLAVGLRSLKHNFDGKYTDGQKLFDFQPHMLLDQLGIDFDEQKFRYYLLLDELF